MFLEADLNATLYNFVFYANITDYSINHVNMTVDNCKMWKSRNLNEVFSTLFSMAVDEIRSDFARGFDLSKLDSNVPFVAGMIKNTTVSPYIANEFMYIGFTFFVDTPIKTYDEYLDIFNIPKIDFI
jgi:hypothetical protein